MIVARAPARISFGGGGTDLPAYYAQYGGFVVSMTIDRHCYVTVNNTSDRMVHFDARDFQRSISTPPDDLPTGDELFRFPAAAVEAVLKETPAKRGLSVTIESDIPVSAGLGSSSALIVALVQALSAYAGNTLEAEHAAQLACEIEIDHLGRGIGKQDQYASAIGGLNAFAFHPDRVEVMPLALEPRQLNELTNRLLLFGTGHTRDAARTLQQQSQAMTAQRQKVLTGLDDLKMLAAQMRDALIAEEYHDLGILLDSAWDVKRNLSSSVSSPEIDDIYQTARSAGALGGKLCGAGGGGHLLFLCAEGKQADVREAMTNHLGLRELTFHAEADGSSTLNRDGIRRHTEPRYQPVASHS